MSEEQQARGTRPRDAWGDPISEKRKSELKALFDQQKEWAKRPEIERGESGFKDVHLTGADVFWLAVLALVGPTGDPNDAETRLRRARENLRVRLSLDLSHLHAEWSDLRMAHLEGATLIGAHLEGASFREAHLEEAQLGIAHLEGAKLFEAHLERADLTMANLEGATFGGAHLEGAILDGTHLEGAYLGSAHLERAYLSGAHLEGKTFGADDFDLARIRQTLPDFPATLPSADLRDAFFDAATLLDGAIFVGEQHGAVRVADVKWGGVNLARIPDWTPFTDRHIPLGDERAAWGWTPKLVSETEAVIQHQIIVKKSRRGYPHRLATLRLDAFKEAVRANRQLATALRNQGMNEQADYFAYRAQVVQRAVLRQQRRLGQWFFSLLLWALAGYGYRLRRILITYILTLVIFAATFFAASLWQGPALAPQQAFLVSLTAVHGRVFFEQFGLNSLLSWVAAIESVVGIVIEGVFVAMLVQRFFAR